MDQFRLHELIRDGTIPSRQQVVRQLRSGPGLLPPGLSATFLAEAIVADLNFTTRRAKHRPLVLKNLRRGNKFASTYHKAIFAALRVIFDGTLTNGKMEEHLNEGRKRVDIVFKNAASSGFFRDLGRHIKCPFIFFECKNYSREIGNSELDQLALRLGPRRGLFGILVCRDVKNKQRCLQRCKDLAQNDRGYVIILEDTDFEKMISAAASGRPKDVDDLLDQKLRELLM